MLVKYQENPFSIFDDLMESFWQSSEDSSGIRHPKCDVIENDKEFIVDVYIAGIKKEDASIKVDDNVLIIKAERKSDTVKYNRKEAFVGIYEKSFILPDNVDEDKINASFADGVLKLIIPKTIEAKAKQKKIEIK